MCWTRIYHHQLWSRTAQWLEQGTNSAKVRGLIPIGATHVKIVYSHGTERQQAYCSQPSWGMHYYTVIPTVKLCIPNVKENSALFPANSHCGLLSLPSLQPSNPHRLPTPLHHPLHPPQEPQYPLIWSDTATYPTHGVLPREDLSYPRVPVVRSPLVPPLLPSVPTVQPPSSLASREHHLSACWARTSPGESPSHSAAAAALEPTPKADRWSNKESVVETVPSPESAKDGVVQSWITTMRPLNQWAGKRVWISERSSKLSVLKISFLNPSRLKGEISMFGFFDKEG